MKEKNLILLGRIDSGKTTLCEMLNNRDFDRSYSENGITIHVENIYNYEKSSSRVFFFNNVDDANLIKIKSLNNAICLFVINCKDDDILSQIDTYLLPFCNKTSYPLTARYIVLNKSSTDSYDGGKNIEQVKQIINSKSDFITRYNVNDIFLTSCRRSDGLIFEQGSVGIHELRTRINSDLKAIEKDYEENEVIKVLNTMSIKLCELVAKNPMILLSIEWRELERIIATVLEGLGFCVVLTPASKDGGKDVIANCIIKNRLHTYYVEIKHWNNNKVGMKYVTNFIEVNLTDNTDGGLFISSSGYTKEVYNSLSTISRQKVRLANDTKIVSLCKQFVKRKEGIWNPTTLLPIVLFEEII